MSAAQVPGDPFCACGCGGWLGQCSVPLPSLRDAYRLPRIALPYGFDEEEPYPTTPPGVLLMPEDEPIDRNAPTEAPETDRERPTKPPKSTTDPSAVAVQEQSDYFKDAARSFSDALVEMRAGREEQAAGFKNQEGHFRSQASDLRVIRHEIQGIALRLTTVEETQRAQAGDMHDLKTGQRDLRGELSEVKTTLRAALERIDELEKAMPNESSAPPAPSTGP